MSLFKSRLLPVLCLCALAMPGDAAAQSVGGVDGRLDTRGLALGPDGAGLLGVHADTTDYSDGIPCGRPPTVFGYVSVRSAGGALGPLRPLGADLAAGPARRPDGANVAVLAQTVGPAGDCGAARNLEFATLDAAGAVTARTPLANGVLAYRFTMLGGVVAWLEEADGTALRLSRDGAPPVTIATGEGLGDNPYVSDYALVATGAGFLLAWAEPKRVRAVEIGADGVPGPVKELGTADSISDLGAGVAANGRAVVAWATQDGGEERNRPLRVYAAQRPQAGAPFAPARTLSRGHRIDSPQSGLEVAVAPDGRALVVWGDVVGRDVDRLRYPLYATVAGPTGRLGRVRRIATQAGLQTVAISSRGAALVVFYRGNRVYLTKRPPSARHFTRPATFGRPGVVELRPGPDGRLLELRTTLKAVHVRALPGG